MDPILKKYHINSDPNIGEKIENIINEESCRKALIDIDSDNNSHEEQISIPKQSLKKKIKKKISHSDKIVPSRSSSLPNLSYFVYKFMPFIINCCY